MLSKKVFLKILQILQENSSVGVSCKFIKNRLQYWCLTVKVAKFLRAPPVAVSVFFREELPPHPEINQY